MSVIASELVLILCKVCPKILIVRSLFEVVKICPKLVWSDRSVESACCYTFWITFVLRLSQDTLFGRRHKILTSLTFFRINFGISALPCYSSTISWRLFCYNQSSRWYFFFQSYLQLELEQPFWANSYSGSKVLLDGLTCWLRLALYRFWFCTVMNDCFNQFYITCNYFLNFNSTSFIFCWERNIRLSSRVVVVQFCISATAPVWPVFSSGIRLVDLS